MDNKKNIFALTASLLSVATVGVLFFAPINGLDFPGTFSQIQDNANYIEKANASSEKALSEKNNLKVKVAEKENELAVATKGQETSNELFEKLLKKQETSGTWSYHVPSLLIELETFADKTGTKVAIDYNSVKSKGTYVSDSKKGLQFIEVSVQIYGEYTNVNEYIKNVENIDFISLQNLKLNLVENGDLAGSFMMKVYYMD